jgi:signal transduction histidine kinase
MSLKYFLKSAVGVVAAGLLLCGSVFATERGSAAEAEALTKKAVAYVKANGQEKAAEEFTNGTMFKDRDLYVSYVDFTGKGLAHGSNPKLVGKELIDLKDPEGKFLVRMAIDVAKTKGHGWTDIYKFKNPTTEKLQDKAMYVERVGEAYVAVGIYK